jgi:KUP system potassium uptake protein
LVLNYFGQGALLLAHPGALENPFFRMFPQWTLVPMVLLATVATVIASQAVISGAFSMTKQAVQLGFLPRMRIAYTSSKEAGQIYVPAVNTALLVAVIGAVVSFRSSTALGAAYGIAVTGTMMITTFLTYFVLRYAWKFSLWPALLSTGFFFAIDLTFFSANLLKIVEGGWFPLVIGMIVFSGMVTWARGRELLSEALRADAIELKAFLTSVLADPPMRAPGTAVFLSAEADIAPAALMHNLKHNNVLHETNVFVTVQTHEVPVVPISERANAALIRLLVRESALWLQGRSGCAKRASPSAGTGHRARADDNLLLPVAFDRPADPRQWNGPLAREALRKHASQRL